MFLPTPTPFKVESFFTSQYHSQLLCLSSWQLQSHSKQNLHSQQRRCPTFLTTYQIKNHIYNHVISQHKKPQAHHHTIYRQNKIISHTLYYKRKRIPTFLNTNKMIKYSRQNKHSVHTIYSLIPRLHLQIKFTS
mgnify:CR=1 FL=1